MSKVITFSRTFPAYHPRKGERTFFVEKFWKSMYDQDKEKFIIDMLLYESQYQIAFPCTNQHEENIHNHIPKHHTIRAGHRFKAGDMFSPAVWSGKPYRSKQIKIAPDIEVKNVWDFELKEDGNIFINGDLRTSDYELIAKNDGLTGSDLLLWFPKAFSGQIICWNENIKY